MRWLIRNFGDPRGVGGRIAGWVMAHRRSNVQRSRWAVGLLDIHPTDRVLEVGCGPGVALAAAKQRSPHVVGVDRSPVMVRAASRRSGTTVIEAAAEALPAFDAPFDKALAVNTVGHWSDPVAGLRSIRDALRVGGTIAVVSQATRHPVRGQRRSAAPARRGRLRRTPRRDARSRSEGGVRPRDASLTKPSTREHEHGDHHADGEGDPDPAVADGPLRGHGHLLGARRP